MRCEMRCDTHKRIHYREARGRIAWGMAGQRLAPDFCLLIGRWRGGMNDGSTWHLRRPCAGCRMPHRDGEFIASLLRTVGRACAFIRGPTLRCLSEYR
jgi:hypothetical protein